MNKIQKKLLCIILILCLCSGLMACGSNGISQDNDKNTSKSTDNTTVIAGSENDNAEKTDVTDSTKEEQTEDADVKNTEVKGTETNDTTVNKGVAGITVPELDIESKKIPDNAALQFVADMKIGWNLGNTFDANTATNTLSDELDYEDSWVGVKTSKEMIDTVKAAGFNTIRIPVSWHNHVDADFNISAQWLDRVQEVVDYAMDNDMYVILNIHHDTQVGYYYPNSENYDTSKKYMTAIWSQLADKFADYSDKLIFESINEPRLVGSNYEWWIDINNAYCADAVDCINKLNQVFVDTVRGTGGNNETRYLMVPGYDASANCAVISQFILPTDVAGNDNKIIVSVHAYTPYNFALQGMTEDGAVSDFSVKNNNRTKDITGFITQLYNKYVSKGIPVVIGEFGARDKNGNLQDRVDFSAFYIATARAMGMTCVWWDNNSFSSTEEGFGLLNRKELTWEYPDIMTALMKYSE